MIFKYEQRCRLNTEACIFYESIGKSDKFKVLILSSGSDDGSEGNQDWMGFVQTIKHFIKEEHQTLIDKFSHQYNRLMHVSHQIISKKNTQTEMIMKVNQDVETFKVEINAAIEKKFNSLDKSQQLIQRQLSILTSVFEKDFTEEQKQELKHMQETKRKNFKQTIIGGESLSPLKKKSSVLSAKKKEGKKAVHRKTVSLASSPFAVAP